MKIEDTLDDLDKGLDDFIRSQKDKIRSERIELSPRNYANGANTGGNLRQSFSRNSQNQQLMSSPRKEVHSTSYSESPRGLTNDHNEFLLNKRRATGGSAMRDAIGQSNNKTGAATGRVSQAVDNNGFEKSNAVKLSETYDELLKRKRLQEQNYRNVFQDPETMRPASFPSNPINGETKINQGRSDSASLKQQRQKAYREALQEQIKEKQTQKQREKMQGDYSSTRQIDYANHRNSVPQNIQPPQVNMSVHMNPALPPQSIANPDAMNGFAPTPSMPPQSNPMLNPYFPMVYNPYIAGMLQSSSNGMLGYDMHSYMNNGANTNNNQPLLPNSNQPLLTNVNLSNDYGLNSSGSMERGGGRVNLTQVAPAMSSQGNTIDSKQQYQMILRQQMQEKQEAKEKEKRERNRYEAKFEAKESYDPWGKSGAGAPIKDNSGRVVADLRKMHHDNQEGKITSPRRQPDAVGQFSSRFKGDSNVAFSSLDPKSAIGLEQSFNADTISGSGSKPLKNFSAVVDNMTNGNSGSKMDEYKQFLKLQVEEKQRKKKEEEERTRLEEEKENLRVEQERIQMQTEFDAEQEKQRKKEIELREKNEELMKIAEQKRKEAEAEQKRLEETKQKEQRMRAQEKLQARLQSSMSDGSKPSRAFRAALSPPQQQQRGSEMAIDLSQLDNDYRSPPPPFSHRKPHVTLSDRDYLDSVRQSIASSQSLRDVFDQGFAESKLPMNKDELLSKLVFLRQKLDDEEHKVEKELHDHKAAYANLRSNSSKRRAKQAFDKARQGNIMTSSRPNSKLSSAGSEIGSLEEAQHSIPYQSPTQQQHHQRNDGNTGFVDQLKLSQQQQQLMREQESQLQSLRSIISRAEKHFSGFSTNNGQSQDDANQMPRLDSRSSRASMLASDSHQVEVESISDASSRQSTARRQRRWKNLQEMASKDTLDGGEPLFDDMTTESRAQSTARRHLDLEQVATRNEERLKMLRGQPPLNRE